MLTPDLIFNAADPFPQNPALSYAEAKLQAAEVDRWLGIRVEETEAEILAMGAARVTGTAVDEPQAWIGLPAQSLLTPYVELRAMLSEVAPEPDQTVIDLGAAYGRMGFVLHRHHAGTMFVGYELVAARVEEGRCALERFGAEQASLITQDLSAKDFHLPEADVYFLYDFGSRTAIEKSLIELRAVSRKRAIRVIGRGRAARDAIERGHPWLASVRPAIHHKTYSIYFS